MSIRRVVTGINSSGKAVVVSDGPTPRTASFKHVPGMQVSLLWNAEAGTQVGTTNDDTTAQAASWLPEPGGSTLMVIVLPPDSVMATPEFDPTAAGGEYMQHLPGLAEKFEMDAPGMHTTDSIDYGVVLDGEVVLELDDGKTTLLKKNDVVVQNGTRHAWRNPSSKPVTMLFVLTGANRTS